MTSNIAIKVENLSKKYNLYNSPLDRVKESLNPFGKKFHKEFYALNNISFQIRSGESIGIVGKNGSGKSTLLKIISGVLTPSTGTVEVNGKISAILELGAGFNSELTGLENIYFNGTLLGYTRAEMDARLDDILAFADIGEFVNQPVKSYSSGMFVRLAFAVSISVDPDILIVDEALSVGDIAFQRKCFAKIASFRSNNKTVIFVSHSLDTMNLFCTRVILLNNGSILEEGAPKHVTRIFQRMMLSKNYHRSVFQNKVNEIQCAQIDEGNECRKLGHIKDDHIKQRENTDKCIEIIDYGITNTENKQVTVLESGNNYILYAKIRANSFVNDVVIGFPIKEVKGILLFSVNNRVQNHFIPYLSKGDVVQCNVEISMWLAPGSYFLSFRAGHGDDLSVELSDAIKFTVVGGSIMVQGSMVNLNPNLKVIDCCAESAESLQESDTSL